MNFQQPSLISWAWLALPVVLLFLVRRRPRRLRVSTLAFFKALTGVSQESPWLRRLKKLLAAALALATLMLAVGALAHLVVSPAEGGPPRVLIVLDGSASMAARDASGQTRLGAAKELVQARLRGLPSTVRVLLMRYDRRPEVLLPLARDRRALERALAAQRVRPVEGDADTALDLAARLAALHGPAMIWHYTDGGGIPGARQPALDPDPASERVLPAGVSLETIHVGLPTPVNAGITAFDLKPRPGKRGRFEVFVQLHASGPGPLSARLTVRLDDRVVSALDRILLPGQPERIVLPLEASPGALLSLAVHVPADALPLDDLIVGRIPDLQPIHLLWVREPQAVDPFTALALSALGEAGGLEIQEIAPAGYDPLAEGFDVLLFDAWLPPAWPAHTPALVMQPPRSLGPIRTALIAGAGLPTQSLRAIDEGHPVLYGVASERVTLTQTAVLEARGSLSPLWVGEMGPLLVAGAVGSQRLVVMAFAPGTSERLGMLASYPLLLGNAISWLTRGHAQGQAGNTLQTGTLVGTAGAALLSRQETVLLPQEPSQDEGGGLTTPLFPSSDLRPLLLWLAFALLLLEAWLFHRHAVY